MEPLTPSPGTILNVDDHEAKRYAKSRVLRHAGFDVVEARDGREALELASARNADIILLDTQLPDMSGFDVSRRLRENPATSSLMIVQTSAHLVEGGSLGIKPDPAADAYLTEPIDPDILVSTVRAMLRIRRLTAELSSEIERRHEAERERESALEDQSRQRAFLQHLIENAPTAIAVVEGPEHRFALANPAYRSIPGTADVPMLGRTVGEVFPDFAANGGLALLDEVYRTGRPHVLREYRAAVSQSREETYWNGAVVPLAASPSGPASILIVAQEVTSLVLSRESAERLVREAERRASEAEEGRRILHALMKHVPEGIAIAEGLDGRVVMVSDYGKRMLEFGSEQIEGASAAERVERWRLLKGDGYTRPAPEDLPLVRAANLGDVITDEEWVIARPDGRNALVLCNAGPVRDSAGKITGAVTTWRDVTELTRLEEQRRKSEARLRTLFDANLVGIFYVERDRITEANDAFLRMLGYSRAELNAGNIRLAEMTPSEYEDADLRGFESLRKSGVCPPFEKEYIRKDGSRVPILVGAAALDRAPGSSRVCFVVDLTERKSLEQQLREAQKVESIGSLAAGIAHDFNNLLTGIIGNASLMLDIVPEPAREMAEEIVASGERAADLTRQLLAYSGKGRFIVQPVHLSSLVRTSAELLKASLPAKIELKFDLETELPEVQADSAQIEQLVLNLVVNASEAIGDRNGLITVRTGTERIGSGGLPNYVSGVTPRQGRYVFLEVSDTGSGIDEAIRTRIFDPFFSTKFLGRGLGLSAASGIVRSHHGTITLETAPGAGSSFKIFFPVAARSAAVFVGSTPSGRKLRGTETILAVDDEPVILHMVKATLESYGYSILTAPDGAAALTLFQQHEPRIALVLLDMKMPGMSGDEVFSALRQIRRDLRIVITTGYKDSEVLPTFGMEQPTGFIQKPYKPADLAEAVRQALETEVSP
jgi:PAS domain S-box-containing protein